MKTNIYKAKETKEGHPALWVHHGHIAWISKMPLRITSKKQNEVFHIEIKKGDEVRFDTNGSVTFTPAK